MSCTPTEITSINSLASRPLVLHYQPERTVTTMHPLIGRRVRNCHMACLQWCPAGGWAGCLPVSLASINCSLRLAYQTVALTGVEVGCGGLFGAAATSPRSSVIRLSYCVRLVESLLDRRRDPAPLADVVAALARPLPHSVGLFPGLPTATT
jgi:hypothetical protein